MSDITAFRFQFSYILSIVNGFWTLERTLTRYSNLEINQMVSLEGRIVGRSQVFISREKKIVRGEAGGEDRITAFRDPKGSHVERINSHYLEGRYGLINMYYSQYILTQYRDGWIKLQLIDHQYKMDWVALRIWVPLITGRDWHEPETLD